MIIWVRHIAYPFQGLLTTSISQKNDNKDYRYGCINHKGGI